MMSELKNKVEIKNTMGIEFNAEPVRKLLEGGIWYNVSHQPLKVI